MLKQMAIRNLVLAENIEIEFHRGLNIITGETGSGKSLLVDALLILRGARSSSDLIRHGTDSATVTGVFAVGSAVSNLLAQHGIEGLGEEVILRRVLFRHQKTKCYVNDIPVSLKVFADFGAELVDVSSQFENQKLLDPNFHAYYLDLFSKSLVLSEQFKKDFELARHLSNQLKRLSDIMEKQKRENELLAFELSEITSLNPSEIDFQDLQNKVQRADRSHTVLSLCAAMSDQLSDSEHSALATVKNSRKIYEKIIKNAPQVEDYLSLQEWNSVLSQLEDLSFKLSKIQNLYEFNEDEVSLTRERLDEYNRLLKKLGPSIQDLLGHLEYCKSSLGKSEEHSVESLRIDAELRKTRAHAVDLAKELGRLRRAAAPKLTQCVARELADLGMPKISFLCHFNPEKPEMYDFEHLDVSGFERVQFLMATNIGEEAKPLEKVVSGGELSRVMLAIKNTLVEDNTTNVFVF